MVPDATTLATAASIVVAALAGTMALLGYRSNRHTMNRRLVFIVAAFGVFVLKGAFTAYNVWTHAVPHDSIEFVLALFDVAIVTLLFIPFFLRTDA